MNRRRVERLDGVEEVVTKKVEVSTLLEPKFLTLTERPANQIAFKVVRDDTGKEPTMTEKAETGEGRRRRIRSTQRSALLYIDFPEGTTEEEAVAAMEEYGIEGYEIVKEGDKVRCRRSDLSETPKDAVTIQIGEGRIAGIVRAETPTYAVQDPMPNVSVVAIEFRKENYADEAAVLAYLQRYDIDFLEKGVENTDTAVVVTRSEVATDAEVRRIEVEPGVVAVVTRAAVADLTDAKPFIEVISETAYGQWGWGQLDFGARMADVEFCEAAEDASYTLRRVVEDILFYSQLPVGVRKELVNRAATQFSAYIGTLLDALPAKVVLINRSNLEKLKEQSMTKATEAQAGADGQTVERKDEATATTDAKTAATQDDNTPVTRSELNKAVGEAVAAAFAKHAPAAEPTAQRSDDAAGKDEDKGEGENTTLKAVEEVVTRSVGGLADAVKTLGDRLTAIEGATTVRSDGADGDAAAASKSKDPFTGIFTANKK